MMTGLRSYLAARGLDVTWEIQRRSLMLSSDQSYLLDGKFDPARMLLKIREAVEQAQNEGYAGLWASADMTWEFGVEKNFAKLLEYERGLEKLFEELPGFCTICQYHVETLPADAVKQGLMTHRGVYLNETLSRTNPYYAPGEPFSQALPDGPLDEMLKQLRQSAFTFQHEIDGR